MAGMLHWLFFEHFQPTSFVIKLDTEIVSIAAEISPKVPGYNSPVLHLFKT